MSRFASRKSVGRCARKSAQRSRSRLLICEGLETRDLLATFGEVGTLLNLDLNVADASLDITSSGSSYALTLAADTWMGTDGANVAGNGTATLVVSATGLATFDTVNITDSATGTAVNFNDSGPISYSDSFNVTLDNSAGAITFSGNSMFTGPASLLASTNRNIVLNPGAFVSTMGGHLTLSANQQATPSSGNFVGIQIDNATIGSQSGDILLQARGGTDSGGHQLGVELRSGAQVGVGATGSVTIIGTAGTGGTNNPGVYVTDAGTLVTSGSGDVSVTGIGGGATGSGNNHGVAVENGARITAGGSGGVAVAGSGGISTGSSGNFGVYVFGLNSRITSSGGDVSVHGTGGGAGTGTSNHGVSAQSGGQITAGGAGRVSVVGIGGNPLGTGIQNRGIFINGGLSRITSSGGNIDVTGIGGGGSGSVGIHFDTSGQLVATLGSPAVTLTADSILLGSPVSIAAASNSVALRPRTAGTLIDLGGADVIGGGSPTLGLTISELNSISAGTILLGDSSSGSITVSAALTVPNCHLSLTTGGDLNVTNPVTMATDRNLVATAIGTLGLNTSISDLTASGSGAIALTTARNIQLASGSSISTAGGSITLTANQGAVAATGSFIGIDVVGAHLASNSGAVTLAGRGGNSDSSQYGVAIRSGAAVGNGTTGPVTVTGTGGLASSNFNHGVVVNGAGSMITSGGGDVSVVGNGGSAGLTNINNGVTVEQAGLITAGGGGHVSVWGAGGSKTGGGNFNRGVVVQDAGSKISSVGGNVEVAGVGGGAGSGTGNDGVLAAEGQIAAGGMGNVTVLGTGGNSAGTGNQNRGVWVLGSNARITSGGGNVGVTGTGGGAGASESNYGVVVQSAGQITAGSNGTVTVIGTGGNGGGLFNHGVTVENVNSRIMSSGGNVSVTGFGGGVGAISHNNYGIHVTGAGQILAGGGGTVDVIGSGGNTAGSGHNNRGVYLTGAGSAITSGGGSVSVTGSGGGAGGSGTNHGVVVENTAQIAAGGSGTVTVTGNGGNTVGTSGNNQNGVYVFNAQIMSNNGDVMVTGTGGGSGTASTNHGVIIQSGGTITAGGSGSVTVDGRGGNELGSGADNRGIWVTGTNSRITSSGGDISVTGAGGGGASFGIQIESAGRIVATSGTPSVTLTADAMDLASTASIQAGNNTVVLSPATPGTPVNLGGVDVLTGTPRTLGVTDAELDRITAGTVVVGNATSGTITVSAALSPGGISTLSLITGANIDDGNTIGTDITVPTLNLSGPTGIGVSGDFALEIDAVTVTASSSAASIALGEANSATIGSAGLVASSFLWLDAGTFVSGGDDRIAASVLGLLPGATLNLNGFDDTIGQLSLYNGASAGTTVQTGTGVLKPTSIFVGLSASGAVGSTISGNLDFDGASRTVTVSSGAAAVDLTISAVISNGGLSVVKNGAGESTLVLSGANTYTGNTMINGVTVRVGSGANVLPDHRVSSNPMLSLFNDAVLDLNGFTEDIGALLTEPGTTVALGSGHLTVYQTALYSVGGQFTGTSASSLSKQGISEFLLYGSSPNFDGAFHALQGSSVVPNQQALGSTVGGTVVSPGAVLLLSSGGGTFTEALTLNGGAGRGYGALENYGGSNTWAGPITLAEPSSIGTTFGGNNLTVSGPIGGPGGLTILGQSGARVTLTGSNDYAGTTTVSSGTILLVNGTNSGTATTIVPFGGTLGGTGTLAGSVEINNSGKLAPGASSGILNAGSTSFANNSTLEIEIGGPTPGNEATNHDQLNVVGSVDLGSGTATLNLSGAYVPMTSDSFILINNDGTDPVTGTFNGLAEGAMVNVNGVNLRITYVGGTGNDVALIPIFVPPTITLGGADNVNEGVIYTLTLGNVEPVTNTIASYRINWGDGTFNTFTGSPNGLSEMHVYADGAAGGTPRTITVDLTDEDGTFLAAGSKTIVVNNVAPTIALGGAESVDVGAVFALNLGTVMDPGTDTVTTYTIHWGDGTLNSFSGSPSGLSKTHIYADAAPGGTSRTITVNLTDEDGTFSGAGSRIITVFGLTLRAWGDNSLGQLGNGTTIGKPTPVAVSGLTNVISVAQGYSHGLALRQDGTVWTWGNNSYGQLGDGGFSSRTTPAAVIGLNNVVAIAAGNFHSLALKSDGTVSVWGFNDYGQLGIGSTTQRNSPVVVSGLSGVTAIAADNHQSLALRSDGTVRAWGYNGYGQLGDGSTTQRNTPVIVSGLSSVTAIAAGYYHSLALRSDGTVRAWGANFYGQLGDGSTTQRTTPVVVSGLNSVTAIAAGAFHSLALRSDRTVRAWGENSSGQLGDGSTTQRTTPVVVSGLSGATAIAAGFYHSLALRSDGTVRAWGYNVYGQLGDGTFTQRNAPVAVSGLSGVASVSASGYSSSARLALVPGWVGTGKAVNGYLVGATAFFDANRNGVLDPDEPSSFTDAQATFNVVVSELFDTNGNSVLDDNEGQWVIQGGIDSSTGLPAVSKLSAPASFSVVTPLTTLISTLSSHFELSTAEATARVQEVFGLRAVELSSLDPIAGSLSGDTAAPAVFAAHARVQDSIAQVVGVLGATGNAPPANEIVDAILAELANQIAVPVATLDLSQAATVRAILQATAARVQIAVDDQVLTAAAAVIASTNQLIDAIPLNADLACLTQIAQVKTLSQGVIVDQLGQAVQGSLDVEMLVQNNTGAALESQVPTSAPPATLVVPTEVLINATSNAGAVVTLQVTASNLAGESVPVDCTPASGNVFPLGTTTVTCSATATDAPTAYATFHVTVIPSNQPPTAVDDDFATLEDQSVNGSVLDNDSDADAGDVLTVVAVNSSPDAVGQPLSTEHGTVTLDPDGNFTYTPRAGIEAPSDSFTYTVSDGNGGLATAVVSIAIKYYPRVAIDSVVQTYVFPVGAPMAFSGTFSHAPLLDPAGTVWSFSHLVGLETVVESRSGTAFPDGASGTIEDDFVFDNDAANRDGAGVYTVSLTVRDSDTGATTSETNTFVVYDPSDGFVSGGGWFDSPPGAFADDPSLTGRANFGFLSKYQKGAANPSGQTEFQFKVANLNFHSSSYQWLVVAGARAQYKGTGTINGMGNYDFLLTAIDGQVNGGGGVDRFRIKIWDASSGVVVYDNQLGASDDSIPTTALGGGQIVIHTAGKKLLAERDTAVSATTHYLTQRDLDWMFHQAVSYWSSQPIDTHQLGQLQNVDIRVASLSGNTLGMASNSTNLIWIDADAAGYGWSLSTEEADPGRMDLLSTLTHELGHVLGLDHDVLGESLAAGVRTLPWLDDRHFQSHSAGLAAYPKSHLNRAGRDTFFSMLAPSPPTARPTPSPGVLALDDTCDELAGEICRGLLLPDTKANYRHTKFPSRIDQDREPDNWRVDEDLLESVAQARRRKS